MLKFLITPNRNDEELEPIILEEGKDAVSDMFYMDFYEILSQPHVENITITYTDDVDGWDVIELIDTEELEELDEEESSPSNLKEGLEVLAKEVFKFIELVSKEIKKL